MILLLESYLFGLGTGIAGTVTAFSVATVRGLRGKSGGDK